MLFTTALLKIHYYIIKQWGMVSMLLLRLVVGTLRVTNETLKKKKWKPKISKIKFLQNVEIKCNKITI